MKVKGKYVAGRDIKIKIGGKKLKSKWAFGLGSTLLCVVLISAFIEPNPTSIQFWVLKTLLAFALASITSSMSGFFQLNLKRIELGGGLLVFALVYAYSPIWLPYDNRPQIIGQIKSDNKEIAGVIVRSEELNISGVSDKNGYFSLPTNRQPIKNAIKLSLFYENFDTTLEVTWVPSIQILPIDLSVAAKN